MPKNIHVILQMVQSYFKHQEQNNICYFFTKENGNLDSEIAKV